ncbi:MAG: hypothetical protein HRU15_19505, partial [Planctomycetes bacterium]|nr:hypothetical protein [Planctomycetota bacterium]
MTTCFSGIDEAGLGPLLGPLSIARCSVTADDDCDLSARFQQASIGIGDSKKIYTSGKIKKLENLALGAIEYFTGFSALTAADVFAVMNEDPQLRTDIPWMAGAKDLSLPLVEQDITS